MKTLRIITSQRAEEDPTFNIVENDTGVGTQDISFKRSAAGAGRYSLLSERLSFSNTNTSVIIGGEMKSPWLGQEIAVKDDDNEDSLQFFTRSEGALSDDVLANTTILIQFFAL